MVSPIKIIAGIGTYALSLFAGGWFDSFMNIEVFGHNIMTNLVSTLMGTAACVLIWKGVTT